MPQQFPHGNHGERGPDDTVFIQTHDQRPGNRSHKTARKLRGTNGGLEVTIGFNSPVVASLYHSGAQTELELLEHAEVLTDAAKRSVRS
ncbi:DeoR family transcriptional regulator [Anopheles sinensis]|uniref:DeoR family transcriptional regulator n=1 Tax=Anopheles sinensis TaxID=74873 RepID=A0A084WH87_ANOSI|nr:DeoR family transcriptional regulator [Anopheles sinensis]